MRLASPGHSCSWRWNGGCGYSLDGLGSGGSPDWVPADASAANAVTMPAERPPTTERRDGWLPSSGFTALLQLRNFGRAVIVRLADLDQSRAWPIAVVGAITADEREQRGKVHPRRRRYDSARCVRACCGPRSSLTVRHDRDELGCPSFPTPLTRLPGPEEDVRESS